MVIAAAPATPSLLPARVEQAITARIADGEHPATVVAIVDGERSHLYGFGKLDNGKAPDAGTVFQIGPITQTFTAARLADAIERGEVELDTPVGALLPGVSIPSRDNKQITPGELAMQDSGLPRLPDNLRPADMRDPYAGYDAARRKAFLADCKLPRDPRARYEYSNLGVGLLGYAFAQRAGTSYAALVTKRIPGPLGMSSTTATFELPLGPDWAQGHSVEGKPAQPWHPGVLVGAGALNSTGADMLRYLEVNPGHGPAGLVVAMRLAHEPRRGIGDGERIGLAWMTRHGKHGDVVWRNGETGGYASFIGFTADGRRGVVILTNIAQCVNDLGLATLLSGAPLRSAVKPVAMSPQQLDAYVGARQLAPGFVLTVVRDGDQLNGRATGQGAFAIFPGAADRFFARVAAITIDFKRNGTGRVTSLALHQNGHDSPAERRDAAAVEKASGHEAVQLDAATLRQYVGHYRLAQGMVFDIKLEHGQLSAQLTGQPAWPVYPSAKDESCYTAADAQLSFERSSDGLIDASVLHQNGADHRAARLP